MLGQAQVEAEDQLRSLCMRTGEQRTQEKAILFAHRETAQLRHTSFSLRFIFVAD